MESVRMHTTEVAEGFSPEAWQSWDAFLDASGEPSVHLTSGAVRASLGSPQRRVRAAQWHDAQGQLLGIAVLEDSEAISQRVDDFLEGTALFRVAKSWLHRQGGLRFPVRVIGTPLASGPHGYRFSPQLDAFSCLDALFRTSPIGRNRAPKTWVVKDHPCRFHWGEAKRASGKSLWRRGWNDLEFDPVMVVPTAGLATWEDYMGALRTKARTKVKRILTLSEGLDFREMGVSDIRANAAELHRLYMEVYGRAGFRLGCLWPEDFVRLKEEMGEAFRVMGVHMEGRLVGFQCSLAASGILEAYFVGFEAEWNKTHALYQRMLVEFIRRGLALGCREVVLGRTALDIKSSLGAEPRRLVLHQRHGNPLVHFAARWAARASAPLPHELKRAWKAD